MLIGRRAGTVQEVTVPVARDLVATGRAVWADSTHEAAPPPPPPTPIPPKRRRG